MERPEFSVTQLDADETVIFGIDVETYNSSLGGEGGLEHDPLKRETRKGITSKRIIIERTHLGATTTETVLNSDVRAITLSRKKYPDGPRLEIISVVDVAGKKHKLGLGGILADRADELRATFPGAQIEEKKGLFAFLGL